MSERWRRRTVTLACEGGRHDALEADVLGALAVHRTAAMPWVRARWSITHVPTGRHVCTANTERLARRFVREVAPLADWEHLVNLGGLSVEARRAFHAAMKRAHGGQYISEIRL